MAFLPSSCRSLTVEQKEKGRKRECAWDTAVSHAGRGNEKNQLFFFKHLTNIPKWLIAQKKSGKKNDRNRELVPQVFPLADRFPSPAEPCPSVSPALWNT